MELLTLLAASPPSWQSLPQDRRRSFLARGLAEEDREGNAAVSPLGLRAVSYAAIFGREGCIGSYPFQFLPMMMSILASGTISEKPSSAEKYLSSALFTSRFPSIDPEKARRYRAEAKPEKEDTCSMCGNFCAVKNMNRILDGEIVSIFDE